MMTDYKELCMKLTEELALYFRLNQSSDHYMIKQVKTYELLMEAREALGVE